MAPTLQATRNNCFATDNPITPNRIFHRTHVYAMSYEEKKRKYCHSCHSRLNDQLLLCKLQYSTLSLVSLSTWYSSSSILLEVSLTLAAPVTNPLSADVNLSDQLGAREALGPSSRISTSLSPLRFDLPSDAQRQAAIDNPSLLLPDMTLRGS